MAEVAALGLKVEGIEGVERATEALGGFTKASESAEKASTKVGQEADKAGKQTSKAGTNLAKAGRDAERGSKDVDKLKKSFDETGKSASNLRGVIAGTFLGLSIAGSISKVISETRNAEQEQAQLAAALTSTGNAAGYSRDQLNDMAASMSSASMLSSGEINQAQTSLLAFTGIAGEQFTEALQAAIDMSARTGMSVVSAAETIGRALDVPSQGLSALSRQGFRFTEEQKRLAEQFEATGRTAEAQGIILGALQESYGGAARAARDTFGGALTGLQNTLNDLMSGSDGSLDGATEAINDLSRTLASDEVRQAFADFVGLVVGAVEALAKLAAASRNGIPGIVANLEARVGSSSDPAAEIKKLQAEIKETEEAQKRAGSVNNWIFQKGIDYRKGRISELQGEIEAINDSLYGAIGDWESAYGEAVKDMPAVTVTGGGAKSKPTVGGRRTSAENKADAQAAMQNARAIDALAESYYLAGITGEEFAVAQAKLSLNNQATEDQIKTIEALARANFRVVESQKERQKFGETAQDADRFILGDTDPLSGGAFDDQIARYEAEAVRENERYAQQLERLTLARELQIATIRSYDELEQEAARQNAARLEQINQAKTSVMLQGASQGFGALADILRASQGEQSGIYRAMFAVSKAFAVADATMNAYTAISKAWASAPFPANLAAVAATTPQVLAVVSAVQGTGLKGMAHSGIDSVPESGTWLLEKGERVTTANTSAKLDAVLSRIDSRQRGGGTVINIIENKDKAGQTESRTNDYGEEETDIFVSDIYGGGKRAQAMQDVYGLRRVGT